MLINANKLQNNRLIWVFLCLIFIIEYLLFRQFVLRDYAPFYPSNFDQTGYLSSAYSIYEESLWRGIWKAIHYSPLSPQTMSFPVVAAISFMVMGPSRLSALSLNFFVFILLQAALFNYVRSTSRNNYFGFLMIGCLLLTNSFFTDGGAADFRIDFMAHNIYGLFICCVLQSRLFLNRKWALISALMASFVISLRFICAAYLFTLYAVILFYYLIQYARFAHTPEAKQAALSRIKNILLGGSIIILLIAPILWEHRQVIHDYYVVGHVTGAEPSMRAREAGVVDFMSNIMFYPTKLVYVHFGAKAWKLMRLVFFFFAFFYVLAILFKRLSAPMKQSNQVHDQYIMLKDDLLFVILSIVVPIVILTLDLSKSAIVPGIVMVPVILLFFLAYLFLFDRSKRALPHYYSYLINGLCFIIFFYGLNQFLMNLNKHYWLYNEKYSTVGDMIIDIGDYAAAVDWREPIVSADKVADYLIYPIAPFYYEQRGVLFRVKPSLGITEVKPVTHDEAIKDVQGSDVFIRRMGDYTPNAIFPFEASIAGVRPLLKQIADQRFLVLGNYYIDHAMYQVYVRPDFKILNQNENKPITDDGLWLKVPALVAKHAKQIILEGTLNHDQIKEKPLHIIAQAFLGNQMTKDLAAQINFNQRHYQITITLASLSETADLYIHLVFLDELKKMSKDKISEEGLGLPTIKTVRWK